jgi:hypothetical protein
MTRSSPRPWADVRPGLGPTELARWCLCGTAPRVTDGCDTLQRMFVEGSAHVALYRAQVVRALSVTMTHTP